jgi:anthranilate synthase component I
VIVRPRLAIHPSPEEFDALAADWPLVPVWTELLADVSTPVGLFPSLAGGGDGVLLESVERSERWGRYSFVAGDPAATIEIDATDARVERVARELPVATTEGGGALAALKAIASSLRAPRLPALPPLTGGLVGYLAYEAAELFDVGPAPRGPADRPGPAMRFLLIDRAAVFDHWRQRLFLVAHVPGTAGYAAGVAALEQLAERIRIPHGLEPSPPEAPPGADPLPNVSEEHFLAGVETMKEHIRAGDIFQGVLSRRLELPAPDGGLPIYRLLRVTNPAPYMFFVRAQGLELAGSSPEPLVRVDGRRVTSRPIAGTRPRSGDPLEDARLEEELLADPKERAEHAMLVDLARNDLGRVCRPGSVRPTELMVVERFSRVLHIVSTVEGELRDDCTALDALGATFPAGTLTGAPKRRAMEIIAGLEPDARGPYAGAVGYLTFAGDLDFCITIRTAVVSDGVAYVQAGAGIVADSDPPTELAETKAKASALLAAVTGRFEP